MFLYHLILTLLTVELTKTLPHLERQGKKYNWINVKIDRLMNKFSERQIDKLAVSDR